MIKNRIVYKLVKKKTWKWIPLKIGFRSSYALEIMGQIGNHTGVIFTLNWSENHIF